MVGKLDKVGTDMGCFISEVEAIKTSVDASASTAPATLDPDQVAFLSDVLPSSGPVYFAVHVAPDKRWRHVAARSAEQLAEHLRYLDQRGDEVYFAPASFSEERIIDAAGRPRRRSRENVTSVRSCWLDIDVGADKAASGRGYSTLDEARKALEEFSVRLEVAPTYVIGSGTGLHCYWVFESEISLTDWDRVARLLKQACAATDFSCDPARTTDVASLMRPAGVHHRKDPANPRLVVVLERGKAVALSVFAAGAHRLAESRSCHPTENNGSSSSWGANATRWFNALPERVQLAALDEACAAIPDSDWSTYETWALIIAAFRGLRTLPESSLLDILIRHSARSPKWNRDGWTLDRVRNKFRSFDGGSVGRLFELAERSGWKPPHCQDSGPFQSNQRAEAERYLACRFIYVTTQHIYLNAETKQIISPAALDESLYHLTRELRVSPRQLLKTSLRTNRVDAIGYNPGAGAIYEEDGRRTANLYVPQDNEELVPTPEELDLWHWLIDDQLFGGTKDKTARDYFLDAIAYPLQSPGSRVASVPLLIGAEGGTGKSTLTEVIPRLIFGSRNVSTATQTEIESSFNDWQAESQVLCLPEIWIGGHRDAEKLANRLKDSVTNPVLRVHPKGLKGYSQPNRTTILATSNYENAVVLREGDRRWGVHVTTAVAMPPLDAEGLYAFLNGPRAPGVLRHLLMSRNLSQFNPFGAPPLTDGKKLVIAASRSDAQDAISEAWESGDFPFDRDLIVLEDVRALLSGIGVDASLRKIGDILRSRPINAVRLKSRPRLQAQRTILGDPTGRRYNGKMVVWAVRNASAWSTARETVISRHLEKGSPPVAVSAATSPSFASSISPLPVEAPKQRTPCAP